MGDYGTFIQGFSWNEHKMNSIISMQNVGVRYKLKGNIFRRAEYVEALKSIDLDLHYGETMGIIGHNGAGKSTLLSLLSGVIRPDSGRIINNNATVSLLSIGVGFEENLNGRDNAIIGGMLQGKHRREVKSRLDEIHDYSELGDFFFKPVRTYSTGMRARLGFSIASIITPDVLLLDEVLSVGDQHFRDKAEHTMAKKIHSSQTVVLVSHAPSQIERMCDRVLLIDRGQSVTVCDPREAIELYNNMSKTRSGPVLG
jgi:lipopolysaccharide transport system ATP-binding protein